MKDRNYWLERGKDGKKKDGYICIGVGNGEDNLIEQINVESRFLWMHTEGDYFSHNRGDTPDSFYYLTEQKFNELFPEQKNMKYVIKPVSVEHSKAIQLRLFELGFKWIFSRKVVEDYGLNPIYLFADAMEMQNTTPEESWQVITFDDLYKTDFFFKQIKVRLNKEYTAVIHKDKIVVGCQEFSMEVFEELKKAVDKVKG